MGARYERAYRSCHNSVISRIFQFVKNRRTSVAQTASCSVSKEAQGAVRYERKEEAVRNSWVIERVYSVIQYDV